VKRTISSLVGTMLILSAFGVTASAAEPTGPDHSSDEMSPDEEATLEPGDLVNDHGVGVVVPPAGDGVHAEALLSNGGVQELEIETLPDGTVHVDHYGSEAASSTADTGAEDQSQAIAPCSDATYRLYPWDMVGRASIYWYLNGTSVPSSLTVSEARAGIQTGAMNMATGHNDCGLSNTINAPLPVDGGTTTLSANMALDANGNGYCSTPDIYSVVDFGPLQTGWAGAECTHFNSVDHVYYAADIRFSSAMTWFTGPLPGGSQQACNNLSGSTRRDLTGVATHEWGHAYGLDHAAVLAVDQIKHLNLTMSTIGKSGCSVAMRTLGKGDILGMEAKY
jgi:hypothetical protein